MMQFGWNPYPSLFMGPTAKSQTAQAVATLAAAGVDVPTAMADIAKAQESGTALRVSDNTCSPGGQWFYALIGAAIVGGLAHRYHRRRAA